MPSQTCKKTYPNPTPVQNVSAPARSHVSVHDKGEEAVCFFSRYLRRFSSARPLMRTGKVRCGHNFCSTPLHCLTKKCQQRPETSEAAPDAKTAFLKPGRIDVPQKRRESAEEEWIGERHPKKLATQKSPHPQCLACDTGLRHGHKKAFFLPQLTSFR